MRHDRADPRRPGTRVAADPDRRQPGAAGPLDPGARIRGTPHRLRAYRGRGRLDVAAIRTRAVRDGDDYIITGAKRFISHGSVADRITVFAVTDPDAGRHERLSCFVVEVPAAGFSVARLEHKMGLRGSPTAELAFDGVRVPGANLIGNEGAGFDIAMRTFDRSRPGIAAQAVGIAQGVLEVATAYAQERRQFGGASATSR